ncbi:MAG: c-type cytochrome [Planctomycetes bacterium]|nr:c-type cytochrome [Planctomycetota bacterium]
MRSCFFILASCLLMFTFVATPVAGADEIFTQTPLAAPSRTVGEDDADQSPPADAAELGGGPAPEWIWGPDENRDYVFRKTFKLPGRVRTALLVAACDNRMTVFVNGRRVASGDSWQQPVRIELQRQLKPGENVLVVEGANEGGPAGLAAKLVLTPRSGHPDHIVTDKSWEVLESRDAQEPVATATRGKMGAQPWGDVFAAATAGNLPQAPRDVFLTLPGYQVELLYTVPKETQGSWVCVTFDDQGRLLASDQGDKGIYRLTPPKIGSAEPTKVEKLDVDITAAQGMLHAFGSLYFSVNGGPGSGFYRARDTDDDDHYDELTKLQDFRGAGEHGPHAIRLSPDGKSLFVVCGNHTDPVKFDHSRIPSNWDEDLLLPRQWDARGHAAGKLAPGGWIAKTDPDGRSWEIYSIGYRNTYDMDFNADGELFAYDADMEWDLGTPWYRPTRVVHAASGSEFGWRSGTGKWPVWYPDSLPPVVDIGPGSPVGATFGYGAKFPAKYQKALYILDWTFGTIYALHVEPDGATYSAVKEEFLSRTPLPLTDAAVGPDGALYFAIGGRGTQSEVYRVTYVGEATAQVDPKNEEGAELRKLRHQLEAYHHPSDQPAKVAELVWPHLGHEDRFIRYAARIALENQPAAAWQNRVVIEKDPQTLITAAVALARQGDDSLQSELLTALNKIEFASLDPQAQLAWLRAYQLAFIRMGEPSREDAARVLERLESLYPAQGDPLNRELVQLLVYLKSPTVITKTLEEMQKPTDYAPEDIAELLARNQGYGGTIAEMLANHPELQKIHYAFALRNMRYGWTLEQRKEYFDWLADAREKSGGASYEGFIDNIRKEALENASPAERKALEDEVSLAPIKTEELPKPEGPGRPWTLKDLVAMIQGGLTNRDFEHGKRAFAASRCIVCHRLGGEGGATGPDLTNVAGRFSYKDLAEAIVDPSKVISDQYRASIIQTADGKSYTGRITAEDDEKVTVLTDPEDATKLVEIPRDEIEVLAPSKTSLMPADLLKVLNREEVLDLMAYLMSRGNPNEPMFK